MTLEEMLRTIVREEMREVLQAHLREMPVKGGPAVPEGDLWLSVDQAAKMAALKPDAILGHIEKKNIPASKPTGSRVWRIRLLDFRAWMGWQARGPGVVSVEEGVRQILARSAKLAARKHTRRNA
jgi:hypothetical protein